MPAPWSRQLGTSKRSGLSTRAGRASAVFCLHSGLQADAVGVTPALPSSTLQSREVVIVPCPRNVLLPSGSRVTVRPLVPHPPARQPIQVSLSGGSDIWSLLYTPGGPSLLLLASCPGSQTVTHGVPSERSSGQPLPLRHCFSYTVLSLLDLAGAF